MLKIKGLKKKKKGKKGKRKEDDLFDPEELEQYRRDHQQKLEAGEATETSGEGTSSEKSEEWKKFQALTAGVDDILKKTQGDLTRIKSTSYYQRNPPGPSRAENRQELENKPQETPLKKWTKFEDGSVVVEEEEPESHQTESAEGDKHHIEEHHSHSFEEEEEELESEQDEDIFDTSYVDVVASGDVKLAYIPDSPADEDAGPDPFDTSIVDKVIKVDPKKRNLVSLGSAVEVLTGKVDKPTQITETQPTKRKQKKQDLLLGSFDEFDTDEQTSVLPFQPEPKSILDEEPDLILEEIDLSINLATNLPPSSFPIKNEEENLSENKTNLSSSIPQEFDAAEKNLNEVTVPTKDFDDDLDDEFAALAQESVLKEILKEPIDQNVSITLDDYEEGFDDGVDPFDTAFAANVFPGKFELKLIEQEILLTQPENPNKKSTVTEFLDNIPGLRLNDATSEHNFLEEEPAPLSFKHRDLLGGSTTDLSKISDCPIEPIAPEEKCGELKCIDPFDTSVVDVLVAPGKTELRFLEKELLENKTLHISNISNDDDFDPRADSEPKFVKPIVRPDQLLVGEKRLSIPKVVAFNIDSLQQATDLLAVDQEENSKVNKPLTPYYAHPDTVNNRPSIESDSNISDPFDTSFISHAPGKAELKLIESELVVENSLSDQHFNPRQDSEINVPINTLVTKPPSTLPVEVSYHSPEKLQPDILSEDSEITVKLHTPVVPKKIEEAFAYSDPFDTSIIQDILPGKAELKLLESELINSDPGSTITRSYTDPDFNPRDSPQKEKEPMQDGTNFIDHTEDIHISEKPLTPQSATFKGSFDLTDDIDPFDTSCVDNLVPGETEIKILESELFS